MHWPLVECLFVVRVLDRTFWVGGLLKYIVTYLLNLFCLLLFYRYPMNTYKAFRCLCSCWNYSFGELFSPLLTPVLYLSKLVHLSNLSSDATMNDFQVSMLGFSSLFPLISTIVCSSFGVCITFYLRIRCLDHCFVPQHLQYNPVWHIEAFSIFR